MIPFHLFSVKQLVTKRCAYSKADQQKLKTLLGKTIFTATGLVENYLGK
jgi:hypothetical protein